MPGDTRVPRTTVRLIVVLFFWSEDWTIMIALEEREAKRLFFAAVDFPQVCFIFLKFVIFS